MGYKLVNLKFYCIALLVICSSCHTKIEPKQPACKDSIEPPKPVEVCNGLGIALSFSPHKYHVGEYCTPIVVLTNLSKEDINIWVNRFRLVFETIDDDGVRHPYGQSFGSHDFGAWQADIFTLKPDESKIFKIIKFGFGSPGIFNFMARYTSGTKEITTAEKKQFSVWTGTLVSKSVTIEFVED
jgi:hypothetical protein